MATKRLCIFTPPQSVFLVCHIHIGYLFYIHVWDSSTAFLLSETELQQKDFLQNQQSIVISPPQTPRTVLTMA
jgi:hypothetical protein